MDEDKVIAAISPDKDVDGFHAVSVGHLWIGKEGFVSCTPAGIIELLKRSDIDIAGTAGNINVAASENSISIDLAETGELSGSDFIKSMTVDKYGRVTALTSGAILDSEIPTTLSVTRTIENATLKNNKLHADNLTPATDNDIASKKYVDAQFGSIANLATGALQFGGSLNTALGAEGKLTSDYKNFYWVAAADIDLGAAYMESGKDTKVKAGDTLIVKEISSTSYKFVHVPSGDDITSISIKGMNSSNTDLEFKGDEQMVGTVEFDFGAPFVVTNNVDQIVSISMPQVSSSADGYLSKSDYDLFKSYATGLAVKYTATVTETTPAHYKIGEIQIGTAAAQAIYGVNNISSLEVKAATDAAKTPYLSFKENSAETQISIKGGNGIVTALGSDNKSIEIKANNTVVSGSEDYLEITNGSEFKVKIGSGRAATNNLVDGLTKYSDFDAFCAAATTHITEAVKHEILTGSLITGATGADSTTYSYGSETLKNAVKLDI